MRFGESAALLLVASHINIFLARVNGEIPPKGTAAYETYRAAHCKEFAFEARFDAYPSEFGIRLKNALDGEVIWGDEDHQYFASDAFHNATDSVCILADECWKATILDSAIFQDGLTKTEGNDTKPGAFTLTFGEQIVAQYDGAAADACYEEKWYEFGEGCQANSQTQGTSGGLCGHAEEEEEVMEAACINFHFLITLDEFPEDVRYFLEGPKGIIWDKAPWDQSHVAEEFTEDTCLPPDGCYLFTVYDSETYPHGLTDAPEGGQPGNFMAWFGDEVVGAYYGDEDGCYAAKWYKFGNGCPANGEPTEGTVGEGCVKDNKEEPEIVQESCNAFHFFIRTDEFPEETKYVLTNSKGEIMLEEQPWTQKHQGMEFSEDVCLPPAECYTFVVYDSQAFQDGLTQAPTGGLPGEFSVTYDNETIGSYDGSVDGCYAAKGYRFGSACPSDLPRSDTIGGCGDKRIDNDQKAIRSECSEFHFSVSSDEFPEDISYTLNNTDGVMIWEERPLTQQDQGKNLDKSTCLNPDDCYTFVIYDSARFQDGLTKSPTGGKAGEFQLKFADEVIGSYDGDTDGCYASKWYRFGNACTSEVAVEYGTTGQGCFDNKAQEEPQLECVGFHFSITTDEFPEDIHYKLEDSKGNELWDDSPWTQLDIGKEFKNYICLDQLDCYTFSIKDKYDDGLTKKPTLRTTPNGGDPGKFELRYGNDVLATYDAAVDGCYKSKTYSFGGACSMTEESNPTDGSCPLTRRERR